MPYIARASTLSRAFLPLKSLQKECTKKRSTTTTQHELSSARDDIFPRRRAVVCCHLRGAEEQNNRERWTTLFTTGRSDSRWRSLRYIDNRARARVKTFFFPGKRGISPKKARFVSRARPRARARFVLCEHLEVTKTTFCKKSRVFVRCSLLLFHKRFPIHRATGAFFFLCVSLSLSLSFSLPNLSLFLFLDIKTTRAKTNDTCSAR